MGLPPFALTGFSLLLTARGLFFAIFMHLNRTVNNVYCFFVFCLPFTTQKVRNYFIKFINMMCHFGIYSVFILKLVGFIRVTFTK